MDKELLDPNELTGLTRDSRHARMMDGFGALADAASVPAGDLVATDQVFPDRVGEIYHLAYDPDQRWYYAPEMTPDEVLLIKGWDSLDDGRARFTPHGAFQLPDQDEDAAPRESIEARSYLIFDA